MRRSTLAILIVMSVTLFAQGGKQGKFQRIFDEVSIKRFNINNISTSIYHNGMQDVSMPGSPGFIYPKEKRINCIFSSGFVWGGKVDGQIRVGGTTHQTGLAPGEILTNGTAITRHDPLVRVFRVRPDFYLCDFISELNDNEGSFMQIRDLYEDDWGN